MQSFKRVHGVPVLGGRHVPPASGAKLGPGVGTRILVNSALHKREGKEKLIVTAYICT